MQKTLSAFLFLSFLFSCSHQPPSSDLARSLASVTGEQSCGLSGDLEQRMHDCRLQEGISSDQVSLVSRRKGVDGGLFEVYYHRPSQTVWTSFLTEPFNYKQAEKACLGVVGSHPHLKKLSASQWRLPSSESYQSLSRTELSEFLPDNSLDLWLARSERYGSYRLTKVDSKSNPRELRPVKCMSVIE